MTQARTYQYNPMCYLVAHDRLQLDYKDYGINIGDMAISDDAKIKTLEALGATINFIDIWIKLLCENFDVRCEAYINAIKRMFMQMPQTVKIALTSKQKISKPMTDICGGWYIGKKC